MDFSKEVDSGKKELLSVLKELISINTVNPPGNEYMAADAVKEFFRKYKIRYRVFEKRKGRTNILGYIGKGDPVFMIATHLDTVSPGDGWKTDPFKAVVKGNKVYGRGTVDNKGPMACSLIAGKILKRIEKRLKGTLIIACLADEERGSKLGMRYLINERKVSADYAIVPDMETRLKKVSVGEKGLLFLRIISIGRQAHGSKPDLGVNAIENMVEFLNEFRKFRYKYRSNIMFTPPTRNLGTIEGGVAPNVVPGKCEARIDFRYLPGMKREDIIREIREIISRVKKKNKKARFEIEVIDDQKPFLQERKSILIRSVSNNIKSIIGVKPEIYGASGTTVAKPLAESGAVTAVFAPGDKVAHIANEYTYLNEMSDFTKILCMTVSDILGKPNK